MREVYGLLDAAAGLDVTVLLTERPAPARSWRRVRCTTTARASTSLRAGELRRAAGRVGGKRALWPCQGAFNGTTAASRACSRKLTAEPCFSTSWGIALAVQAKLNRALQDKEIRRAGENTPFSVDVRIIAATHRELKAEVQAGRFREDLFYRLHVFPSACRHCAERREDIPGLAAHFSRQARAHLEREITGSGIRHAGP